MPKRRFAGESTPGAPTIATWQAVGLSLTVLCLATLNGPGVAVGALVIAAPVIYAIARLRAHVPEASSTSDLVGATLGGRAGSAAGLIQLTAYLIMAKGAAAALGLQVAYRAVGDETVFESWLWPLFSVAAALVAGLVTCCLPMRIIGAIVAVLAAAALLIPFYLSLAVIARVLSGTEPVQAGPPDARSLFPDAASLLLAAATVVGFELATTANRRLRSSARPMAVAVALVAVCALATWLAMHLGLTSGFRSDPSELLLVVAEMYGTAGQLWATAAGVAGVAAALIGLTAAGARILGRQVQVARGGRPPLWTMTLTFVAVTAWFAIAVARGWGGVDAKVTGVAPMLLLALYALVAQANSRVGDQSVDWWIRWGMLVVLAAVVAVPMVTTHFTAASIWPVALTAAVVALAFLLGAATGGSATSATPIPPPGSPGLPVPTAPGPPASDTTRESSAGT